MRQVRAFALPPAEGEVTVGFGVIQLETDGRMVFGNVHHIGAAVEQLGEGQLQAPIAHEAVEDAARWHEEGLLFHQEGRVASRLRWAVISAPPRSITVAALLARLKGSKRARVADFS